MRDIVIIIILLSLLLLLSLLYYRRVGTIILEWEISLRRGTRVKTEMQIILEFVTMRTRRTWYFSPLLQHDIRGETTNVEGNRKD